jgi:hypothetical protein
VLQRSMYSNPHGAMPPPQSRSVAPETFLLDQDAQQSLPPDSIVALQQVDNRMSLPLPLPIISSISTTTTSPVAHLVSAVHRPAPALANLSQSSTSSSQRL